MFAAKTPAYAPCSIHKMVATERQFADVSIPCQDFSRKYFSQKINHPARHHLRRGAYKATQAVLSGVNGNKILSSSSSSAIDGFTVTATDSVDKGDQLKITVEVSGSKTQEIYNEVFSKMVEDAQPIPGFRRVKGGKTPNIPENILLEILGPSNVYEQVIRKVINSTISEYVAKEGLSVEEDLQIEQSLEDLMAGFEPGSEFRFNAIVQCHNFN